MDVILPCKPEWKDGENDLFSLCAKPIPDVYFKMMPACKTTPGHGAVVKQHLAMVHW